MKDKPISASKASISSVMLLAHANPAGNVHGGEIMKMMDVAASVCAMKHARSNVVTLRVDELIFYHPIYVGELVTCNASIVFTGKTSMEIKVSVAVEDIQKDTEEKIAQTAYFKFVALDSCKCPTPVPGLILNNEEERKDFEQGKKRYEKYKAKKKV